MARLDRFVSLGVPEAAQVIGINSSVSSSFRLFKRRYCWFKRLFSESLNE